MSLFSVIIPVYNERGNLEPLFEEIATALAGMEYEVVAVDDGSADGSLQQLERLREQHPTLKIVALERHAGQSAALMAGFEAASGSLLATMDADGQNDPADIPPLLRRLESDQDLAAVVGYRAVRADSRWKRVQSSLANAVRNYLTGDRVRDTGCPLKVMRRAALLALPRFEGMHRFYPTLIRLAGGDVVEVQVSHRPRLSGVSKYGVRNRALRTLRDALGVRWLRSRALRYQVRECADSDVRR